jgi:hypothetical protein
MMQNLNERLWKKANMFGNAGFLKISATHSSIDSVRLKDGKEKSIPYITRSDSNNGIALFVSEENLNCGSDDAGCITIGLDTQTAFYQPYKFVTGQNIQIVTNDFLNENTAQFFVTVIKNQMTAKFNWGGNGATLGRMKRLEALIPITDSGNPDYSYMAQYTQEKRKIMLGKYRVFAERRIAELGESVNIPTLKEKKWQIFIIKDIADVYSGRDIYAQERTDGLTPLITAVGTNNGIGYFVGNENDSRAEGSISVVRNGASVAKAFYHKYPALYGNDCRRMKLKNSDSEYVNLFITQMIGMQNKAFSYSRKLGTERLLNLKIMLPVTDDGSPDYSYMEQYTKNMMLRKYRRYLAYLDSKGNAATPAASV